MRDCRLECVQAVIERQKRMPAKANDDRLFLDRQHRRSRFLWSRPSVHDRAARLPLAHRLLIDAVTSGERSQALFTMLYRSTDRLSRRGAPVKNLAHSASFDSCNKNAPSKCGTKQLGNRPKRTKHHTALPYTEVPAFVAELGKQQGVSALALLFTIFTAARTTESLQALKTEFRLAERVWVVPPERMKGERQHRVPLSDAAMGIVEQAMQLTSGPYLFPGQRSGRPLSKMAMAMLLRRMGRPNITVHGFRSSFRDWAGDETHFPREVAEAALAHVVGDEAEQAYRRSDALTKRRALMQAWADYIENRTGDNIVPLKTA